MSDIDPQLLLGHRSGLPEDLRYLLERYPRDQWQAHENLGGMAQFWLQRHDMFRELGGMLTQSVSDYREGQLEAQPFASFFVPRLQFFLQQLHGHHQIEDMHYFPALLKLQPKLQRGFDILDRDHHAIHDALDRFQAGAVGALNALQAGPDDPKRPIAEVLEELRRMDRLLDRHLFDEEEIVIPIMLDAGEDSLGL